jgi:hypothetical protein
MRVTVIHSRCLVLSGAPGIGNKFGAPPLPFFLPSSFNSSPSPSYNCYVFNKDCHDQQSITMMVTIKPSALKKKTVSLKHSTLKPSLSYRPLPDNSSRRTSQQRRLPVCLWTATGVYSRTSYRFAFAIVSKWLLIP